MKTCKNHLDRLVYIGRKCKECYNKDVRQAVKKQNRHLSHASNWNEINLRNILDDAKRLTLQQLASRYKSRDVTAIADILKSFNIEPKKSLRDLRREHKAEKEKINPFEYVRGYSFIDITPYCDIQPKF